MCIRDRPEPAAPAPDPHHIEWADVSDIGPCQLEIVYALVSPVSYTHLYVYKRQDYARIAALRAAIASGEYSVDPVAIAKSMALFHSTGGNS